MLVRADEIVEDRADGKLKGPHGHPFLYRRRGFITLLGGAAAVWPVAVRGQQQPGKLPTIGFLGAASPSIESQRVAAFVQRLRELAWIDGRNLAIEYRWTEGRDERYAEIAAEFVRLKVDVIVTVATPATLAAKQATAVIPIVFVTASDPVGTGLVASLARPGGNVTGLANQMSDTKFNCRSRHRGRDCRDRWDGRRGARNLPSGAWFWS